MNILQRSYLGRPLADVPTPAFLVCKEKVVENCQKMIKKCEQLGLKLRPHVKTHKTEEGALLQTGGRKNFITVSTFNEAEFFADRGWDDILVARPLAPFHLERVKSLANHLTKLHLVVDNILVAKALASQSHPKDAWSVFIKIDAGYGRAGVRWSELDEVKQICDALKPSVKLQGLYAHCGEAYHTSSQSETREVRQYTAERVATLGEQLTKAGYTCPTLSIGSTPSLSQNIDAGSRNALQKLTEVHPGNYAFYDLQQAAMGSCSLEDIACRVMTRVIGHYPHRKQLLVDCGFTALTKQGLDGNGIVPGYAVFENHPNLKLIDMSQEFGKVEAVNGDLDFNKYPIGTPFYLYPYHACAASHNHGVYYVHKDGLVTEEWKRTRGW